MNRLGEPLMLVANRFEADNGDAKRYRFSYVVVPARDFLKLLMQFGGIVDVL